ncbi:restriction endonuclease subunit S [Campylobacter lari]|nr:restriction endonuclease subunit S [Campylobacter lari]MCV3406417.1 restriction endonuclease subunit S [Campylobacter lari]
MSKIEKLLEELCPNGVEFKSLGEVCEVVKGQQLNKNLLLENGLYPVMNGGINPSGYWDTYNKNAQTIIISQGGASAGYVNFMQTPFWAGAHCYTIEKIVEFLNYKFIYYFLKNNQNNLIKLQYGAGIPALNKIDIQTLQIPIPPLEVQEEIVKILDTFTKLEAELEAELEARRRQYEYYRNKLLSFEYLDKNGGGYELKMLGEVGNFTRGSGLQKKDLLDFGIPCIHYGQIHTYYNNYTYTTKSFVDFESAKKLKKAKKGDLIIAGASENIEDICKAIVYLGENNVCISGDSFAFSHSLNPKYVGYVFQSERFIEYKKKYAQGTKVMRLSIERLKQFQIPIPPLATQEKIVSILDKFHTLTTDLQSGIPAEIKARKKQYEYYRNKLLTFKEAI